jgi:hypothetical protein
MQVAIHNPGTVRGWGQAQDPDRPVGFDNPARTALGLMDPLLPWDPDLNPLVYKVCELPSFEQWWRDW